MQIGRDADGSGFVFRSVAFGLPLFVTVPVAVGVECGEPKEKRFILRALLHDFDPVSVTAAVAGNLAGIDMVKRRGLRRFAGGGCLEGHVMFAAERGVVASLAEQAREPRQVRGDGLVEFGGATVVVRIAAGHDAAATRAATARGQIRGIEATPVGREAIEVGRARGGIARATEIVPAHVVGDEENHVGAGRCGWGGSRGR